MYEQRRLNHVKVEGDLMQELERLDRVENLRDTWPTEDGHFTPWLEKNIDVLGESLDIPLVVESREESVGDHWADLVCTDTTDQSTVLIENQIAPTDHSHIGQILTYAANLKAVTIVWIAERIKDDHRAAIDWLNEVTRDSVRFFALEIELWKIGSCGPAPKFNVVSKPNDWARAAQGTSDVDKPPRNALIQHFKFWTEFVGHVQQSDSQLRTRSPRYQHSMEFSIGKGGANLSAVRLNSERSVRVQLVLSRRTHKAFFRALMDEADEINGEIGLELDWRPRPTRSSIDLTVGMDPADEEDWGDQMEWFIDNLEAFDETFRDRIARINPEDWPEPEDDSEDDD